MATDDRPLRYGWTTGACATASAKAAYQALLTGEFPDPVEVTLPGLGETIKAGQACGDIESVKSVNDLVAPVAGTVRARNDDLAGTPEVVNTDPYGQGWMFEVGIDPSTLDQQLASLMDAGAYRRLAGA